MSIVKYTRDHEWLRVDADTAVIGITDYAQTQLGDIVYVELPTVGRRVEKGKDADPMGEGWFIKLRIANSKELDELMDEAQYQSFVEGLH